jgi:hypothetical protein
MLLLVFQTQQHPEKTPRFSNFDPLSRFVITLYSTVPPFICTYSSEMSMEDDIPLVLDDLRPKPAFFSSPIGGKREEAFRSRSGPLKWKTDRDTFASILYRDGLYIFTNQFAWSLKSLMISQSRIKFASLRTNTTLVSTQPLKSSLLPYARMPVPKTRALAFIRPYRNYLEN